MKKKEAWGFLIAGCVLAVAVSYVSADTWKGLELRRKWDEAVWAFGPFKIQPMLVVTNAGYDSNVYYGASSEEPIRDYTVTAGPALDVYVPIRKKFALTAYVSPRYVYYRKTERERTWNYYGRADVNFLFNRFFIRAGAGYSDARERWNTEI
ncbi:MAG: hypothetical protein JW902_18045, partial [Syntrophaceae bacterium]|nr:hypothetical protein [Syntrophaceae bacterium]